MPGGTAQTLASSGYASSSRRRDADLPLDALTNDVVAHGRRQWRRTARNMPTHSIFQSPLPPSPCRTRPNRPPTRTPPPPRPRRDFIREMVAEDVATNRFGRPIATRFPPEPNGFPHIGHVKSICLNFGIASEFDGRCNLRFDDTNPFTEDIKYVEAIKNDIEWLGFEWDAELYASDYFEKLYEFGELLVKKGKAYVDSQTDEEIRAAPRHGHGAGHAEPRIATARSTRISTCCAA